VCQAQYGKQTVEQIVRMLILKFWANFFKFQNLDLVSGIAAAELSGPTGL